MSTTEKLTRIDALIAATDESAELSAAELSSIAEWMSYCGDITVQDDRCKNYLRSIAAKARKLSLAAGGK